MAFTIAFAQIYRFAQQVIDRGTAYDSSEGMRALRTSIAGVGTTN